LSSSSHWLLSPPISVDTLEKYYADDLAIGEAGLKANMMSIIVKDAIENKNPKSAQWVMEKRFLLGALAASRTSEPACWQLPAAPYVAQITCTKPLRGKHPRIGE
jgi:hypothetical protein